MREEKMKERKVGKNEGNEKENHKTMTRRSKSKKKKKETVMGKKEKEVHKLTKGKEVMEK
jgi:hypothetical protein